MTTTSTRAVRKSFSLTDARREFGRHPSPWMLGVTLLVALGARIMVGDWQITDAVVPAVMLAVFPFFEWLVHVCILHWRPRQLGRLRVDLLLARKHREHHVDPRDIPLIFIPWQALLWVLPGAVAIALLAFPRSALGLTFLGFAAVLGLCYEWCHYLIHSDYKPKTAAYRAVWRNHRQHHFKNEHYWFTVTSTGTADRVLGTYPDSGAVATSPTAKNLHAQTN
ncbi:fatty acid hydroxylase-like protein [Mycolicibacterium chubuense NBB4]|uniref:Fatty acid hydroxylase-like protein n=1 Tax=Mycolicibacterium chubuense (strain NBB4) TaxID=710421 RepID=I4BMM5_MYCCN|nr:sterol desaturase family protein [Mycolicibacterium chubuense]AFM18532.1 fatty acid hydroxylase-like protein [Mycolicibacterium chubuense NBB4]